MATRLYIVSSGVSDVLAATMLHDDPARPPVVLAYAWERVSVDPVPGPRGVADFENLGHTETRWRVFASQAVCGLDEVRP